jgi:hypothetical protein
MPLTSRLQHGAEWGEWGCELGGTLREWGCEQQSPPHPTPPQPAQPRPLQAIKDWFIGGPNAYGTLTSLMAVAFCLMFPRDPAELVKTESRFFGSESRAWPFGRRGGSTLSSSHPRTQSFDVQVNSAAAAAAAAGGGGGGGGTNSAPADHA